MSLPSMVTVYILFFLFCPLLLKMSIFRIKTKPGGRKVISEQKGGCKAQPEPRQGLAPTADGTTGLPALQQQACLWGSLEGGPPTGPVPAGQVSRSRMQPPRGPKAAPQWVGCSPPTPSLLPTCKESMQTFN